MNDDPASANPDRDQLALEGAHWFARLRGPDADACRPAFEAWLARGAAHLAAYNRAAEIFSMGKFMADEERALVESAPSARPSSLKQHQHRWSVRITIAAAAAIVVAAGTWLAVADGPVRNQAGKLPVAHGSPQDAPLQLASRLGEIRTVELSDGSHVTLDSDTLVSLFLGPTQRRLRLERGRARFEVAHETRPFIVAAGSGTVTARGTIFDVSLSKGHRVSVRLLRGRVDVDMPDIGRRSTASGRRTVQLRPGDEIAYADMASLDVERLGTIDDHWTDAVADFDQARLRDVIARANAVSAVKIRASDPSIGDIRISGSFKVNDGAALAHRLAFLFGLRADDGDPMEVVLRRP